MIKSGITVGLLFIAACMLLNPLTISTFAIAQDAPVKGDMEYGEYLAAECVTCHSAQGKDKGIPPINAWDEESFVSVVNAYKSKELENPAMQLIASRLDDEQIASLALYFATQPEIE